MTDRFEVRRPGMRCSLALAALLGLAHLVPGVSGALMATTPADEWPLYSYDFFNSNNNPAEYRLSQHTAPFLRRAWETFNDDQFVPEPPPTGFVLESVLGLEFPASVVGVVASPILKGGVLYYVDALGTVFARDPISGGITDPLRHWTTTLVDPDFDNTPTPVLPELIYTAPVVTDTHVWVVGSVYGRLHAVERLGGSEVDFARDTPEIDPFPLVTDLPFASVLGDSVVVDTASGELFITSINVILNDALVQGREGGLQIAFDIGDPENPVEVWRTPTIDLDPDTGLRFSTGVSAGAGLAVDTGRALIFGGTGQNTSEPYPGYPDPELAPPGYIDRGDSLYAIDYRTGHFVWTNQFHQGDVFDLNDPVSTGPNRPDGPRDADVLSPPVLFSAWDGEGDYRDLAGNGSKGGLFRVVDRATGATVWERQISKPTGIGGIQAGAAYADGTVFVAGFEGIDDGFSDAQFGTSLETGNFANAFFATFSPAFWADVEDTADDDAAATGMRIKLYSLDAGTGESNWHFPDGRDFVELPAGAVLRHVSTANGLVYVAASSGRLFVLDAADGALLFSDQTPDLNEVFDLGLGKPHHASMNSGAIISGGRVYVGYGAQNNPSGGVMAYEINRRPRARIDFAMAPAGGSVTIEALKNDVDPNGDRLRFATVAGRIIDSSDGQPDIIPLTIGTLEVFNPGDDPDDPQAAFLRLTTSGHPFPFLERIPYTVEDLAPDRIVNGVTLDEPNPTHVPRTDSSAVLVVSLP